MAFLTSFLTRADVIVYFAVFLLLLIYWLNRSKNSRAKMPPGPTPLPFIGNLHQLDLSNTHQSLMEVSEKYGDVFTLHFGPTKVVVIAGYKAVKEALVTRGDDFVDRPSIPLMDLLSTNHGILFSSGEEWRTMRRFILSTLRDFGMGKKSLEGKIHEEIIALIEIFKSYNGKSFNPHLIVNSAVSNVICSIIFGNRFEYDDPTFQKLIRMLDENAKIAGEPKALLFNFYPFIGRLLGLHKKVMQNVENLLDFIIKCAKKRRLEFNANDIAGFIDAYLLKQEQESTKPDTYFSDKNLYHSVMDLFDAGSETTSTTIRWGILMMMKHPDIQKKIQDEIKMHIKPGQLPTLEDRKKMPYTDAVIHELQRFGNILPLNLSHAPPTDVYFRGYLIPKGTEVIPFLSSVLNDKTQWKTPHDFNPNHFLDKDGKFVRNDAFMPFSAGRRACAGESLAKMELFLFFTGLLQAFSFYPPPGVSREDLTLKPDVGFTLAPTPYMTCAKLN